MAILRIAEEILHTPTLEIAAEWGQYIMAGGTSAPPNAILDGGSYHYENMNLSRQEERRVRREDRANVTLAVAIWSYRRTGAEEELANAIIEHFRAYGPRSGEDE